MSYDQDEINRSALQQNDTTEQSAVTAEALPSVFEMLKETWKFYRARFGLLVAIAVLPALALSLVSYIGTNLSLSGGIFLLWLLVFIAVLLFYGWGQLALLHVYSEKYAEISVVEAYRKSLRNLLSYYWILILNAFITLGAFLLFIIPGIILTIWFAFGAFVLVSEQIKGFSALIKSREYVRGYWWSVLWRMIAIVFVTVIALFIFDFSSRGFRDDLGEAISSFFFAVTVVPFIMAFMYFLYEHLKSRKRNLVLKSTTKTKVSYTAIAVMGYVLFIVAIVTVVVLSSGSEIISDTFST